MRPLLSAHRGGPEGTYPPNSLAAIRAVLDEAGAEVDLVEFDVRVTADGGFVMYHDDSVVIDRRRVRIEELSIDQVLACAPDAARLADVLALLRGRAAAHVDLKDARGEVEIADLCESVLGPGGFVITTLEDESVRRIRAARPHLQVGLSLGRGLRGLGPIAIIRLRWSEWRPARRVRACDPTLLAINYTIARAGALRWANRHGLPVLAWTINDPRLLARIATDRRIWAFTTDYPRKAIALRRRAAAQR